jgi:hypothetical protein
MKNYFPFVLMLALVVAACTSSEFATYRPPGSTEASWQINVVHSSGMGNNFKVVINDSTVIDESVNMLTGNLEEKGKYRGREVKLMVTYSHGFMGNSYETMVFIENELVGKFKF